VPQPPIIYEEGFVGRPDELFAHLVATTAWDERMRARKTASFGVAYNYSQMAYPETPMPPRLLRLCEAIERRLGFLPDNCLVNAYPDGQASMGFHSDDVDVLADDTGVAIISLGARRNIVFRYKADRSVEHAQALAPGSLLYMPKDMQGDWLHAVPKTPGARERISLTFRRMS